MKNVIITLLLAAVALIMLGVVAIAITPDPEKRNFEIFNEMVHTSAYPSQSANPLFSDGMKKVIAQSFNRFNG